MEILRAVGQMDAAAAAAVSATNYTNRIKNDYRETHHRYARGSSSRLFNDRSEKAVNGCR